MRTDPTQAGLTSTPASAVRVIARRGNSQILIVYGSERAIADGERLAWIDWFTSASVAEAVAQFCSWRLIEAQMPPDQDGWHPFAVEHLPKLVALAKTHLNVTIHPPSEPAQRQAWTGERIARLGFLAGLGWTAKKIAIDPLIRSTPNNVYRQAHRFGIALSDGPQGQVCIRLPLSVVSVYDKAAERAQLTRDAFVRRFLIAQAAEPARVAAV